MAGYNGSSEYYAFRIKKTNIEALVKSYRLFESRINKLGYTNTGLLGQFIEEIDKKSRENENISHPVSSSLINGKNPVTTQK